MEVPGAKVRLELEFTDAEPRPAFEPEGLNVKGAAAAFSLLLLPLVPTSELLLNVPNMLPLLRAPPPTATKGLGLGVLSVFAEDNWANGLLDIVAPSAVETSSEVTASRDTCTHTYARTVAVLRWLLATLHIGLKGLGIRTEDFGRRG